MPPCPRCGGRLLPELADPTELFCLACGERVWGDGWIPAPLARSARARPGEGGNAGRAGRRLLFSPAQVDAIEKALAAGVPIERVARRFGCAYETIRRIRAGEYH
jgi:hypothetical protein